jgi:perosamine synthetase
MRFREMRPFVPKNRSKSSMDNRSVGTDRWIPWWTPSLGEREKQLVCEVLDSNFINDGTYTTSFEEQIAELCDVPHAVAVTSGTTAIFLGLTALGIGPGDEVIVPDITFIATANAVSLTGATPVLVDVSANDFTIDPVCVHAAITPRTKAFIPVHVSGRAADMEALMEIASEHHLHVIEDAAEALGSRVVGRALGTFGDIGCFSFSANKTITLGQGGMVVTRHEALHRRLRELKDHGRPARGTGGADTHPSLGYNFKLTNVQAAIGLAQLTTLAERQEHLRRIFCLYREGLGDVPQVRLPGFDLQGGECPQWIDAIVDDRDGLYEYLLAHKVQTRKFWFPLHTQVPYRAEHERFPASLRVSAHALWLPSALSLTSKEIQLVCQYIRTWSRQNT